MYARSSSVLGDPRSIDAAVSYLQNKVMPAVLGLDGYVGLSMLADRESGRCIATTSWRDEPAMHDSESPLHALRGRYGEILGGRAEVQEWEIAVVHRVRHSPPGACARVVWTRGGSATRQAALDTFRQAVLPRLEELPGFVSVSMLVDRAAGRAVSSTGSESRDAMASAAATALPLRTEFTRSAGGEVTEIAEFDVVLAHLRVPETV
jgi:hypothetical protein